MFKNSKKKRIEKLEKEFEEWEASMQGILEPRVTELEETIADLEDEMKEIRENMDDYKKYREEKELMKNSGEPWVDFETRIVEDGRVEVKMDWNTEFIEYLKKEGINAPTESEMVSIYFSSLVREAGQELTEEEAEQYSNG